MSCSRFYNHHLCCLAYDDNLMWTSKSEILIQEIGRLGIPEKLFFISQVKERCIHQIPIMHYRNVCYTALNVIHAFLLRICETE